MDNLINLYKQRLNLKDSTFLRIDHEDATVAIVYKIIQKAGIELILKICPRPNDYLREVYFLEYLADKLPIPRIIQTIQPEPPLRGAILMECLPGRLLKINDLNNKLVYELGVLLARIHLNHLAAYGDPIQQKDLSKNPLVHFNLKFEEGFSECNHNLPNDLLKRCQNYYDSTINLLTNLDGPCIVHRDFRPGNIMFYNGKIQGIIDWAGGRASFTQEDFCNIENGEWSNNPEYKKNFLAGYASIRPIPEYNEIMLLLRMSKAFATIGFLVKNDTWDKNQSRLYQLHKQFLENFF